MLCAEGVLKTKKTRVKRRKCINAPNCKPKQNAWEKGLEHKLHFWRAEHFILAGCCSNNSSFVEKGLPPLLLTRLTHGVAQIFLCKAHRNCWGFSGIPLGFQSLSSVDSSPWVMPPLPARYQGAMPRKNLCRKKKSFKRNTRKQIRVPSYFLFQQTPWRSPPCWESETRGEHA